MFNLNHALPKGKRLVSSLSSYSPPPSPSVWIENSDWPFIMMWHDHFFSWSKYQRKASDHIWEPAGWPILPAYVHNREKTRTRAHTHTETEITGQALTQIHTAIHSHGLDSLPAPVGCCIFADVKLVTVNNNKDETGITSVNSLTNALSALSWEGHLRQSLLLKEKMIIRYPNPKYKLKIFTSWSHSSTSPLALAGIIRITSFTFSFSADSMWVIPCSWLKVSWADPSERGLRCGGAPSASFV